MWEVEAVRIALFSFDTIQRQIRLDFHCTSQEVLHMICMDTSAPGALEVED
jgi:hypothetical protein